jgi:hypothetical protein
MVIAANVGGYSSAHWHDSCSPANMYLREGLKRCQELEEQVAHIYEELAAQHATDETLKTLWSELACDERFHSRLIAALLAAEEAREDDGPFVVDLRPRLDRLRRILDHAYQQVRSGMKPAEAVALADFIEGSELNDVFAEVVELARPAVLRLLGSLENVCEKASAHRTRLCEHNDRQKGERHARG